MAEDRFGFVYEIDRMSNSGWKSSELSDRLNMLLIVGNRTAEHSLRSQVGIGSYLHTLLVGTV